MTDDDRHDIAIDIFGWVLMVIMLFGWVFGSNYWYKLKNRDQDNVSVTVSNNN